MIDLHAHVLPGLDDGAADLEEAVGICRAAAEDGIEMIAATPHVRDDYPTTPARMERALAELRTAVGALMRLLPGAELAHPELQRPLDELRRFGLAGNPGYLLVETPYVGWPLDLSQRLFDLRAAGIVPVLAHPERNPDVQRQPSLLEPFVATGTLVQLTAASLEGRLGGAAADCSRALLERNLAHLIASDAHGPTVRSIGLSAAAEAVGEAGLARWLTVDVPRAIVYRLQLPVRPAPRKLLRRR